MHCVRQGAAILQPAALPLAALEGYHLLDAPPPPKPGLPRHARDVCRVAGPHVLPFAAACTV